MIATIRDADALRAVRPAEAAAASGTFAPFDAAVESGVSANLCDALVAMSREETAEAITIAVHWASSRPASHDTPLQARFGRDAFPLLREAARQLRRMNGKGRLAPNVNETPFVKAKCRRLPA